MNSSRLIDRPPLRPVCFKHHAVRKWVLRCLGTVEHEDRVSEIAGKLLDLTWSLHDLSPANRRLLRLAAMVHDVGRSIDDETHPLEGSRMLLDDRHQLPLTSRDRRFLSYLTRYHRGKVPAESCDEILRADDDAATLRLLLAFLRAADALDSRSLDSPRLVFSMQGRRLRIVCYLDVDSAKARRVFSRRKKFRLLEELLGCRVEVEIRVARELHLVA